MHAIYLSTCNQYLLLLDVRQRLKLVALVYTAGLVKSKQSQLDVTPGHYDRLADVKALVATTITKASLAMFLPRTSVAISGNENCLLA